MHPTGHMVVEDLHLKNLMHPIIQYLTFFLLQVLQNIDKLFDTTGIFIPYIFIGNFCCFILYTIYIYSLNIVFHFFKPIKKPKMFSLLEWLWLAKNGDGHCPDYLGQFNLENHSDGF